MHKNKDFGILSFILLILKFNENLSSGSSVLFSAAVLLMGGLEYHSPATRGRCELDRAEARDRRCLWRNLVLVCLQRWDGWDWVSSAPLLHRVITTPVQSNKKTIQTMLIM